MHLQLYLKIAVVFLVIAVVIYALTELLPRWRSKRRHDRHLDQLYQFDHLRRDRDLPDE